jgi:hypothetical protein
VIDVAVREDENVQVPEADSHLLRVGKEQSGQTGIKQDLLSGCFDQEREPGLATVIMVRGCSVIDKDREDEPGGHGRISIRERDELFLFFGMPAPSLPGSVASRKI